MGSLIESRFRAARFIRNPHLQTLWPVYRRPRPHMALSRQRLELDDGDFIDLSWAGESRHPVVIVIHGLEGSLRSHYAKPQMAALRDCGFAVAFMHLRGSGSAPNRLDRSYHAGASDDLEAVIRLLQAEGRNPVAAVGFSLGANLLLKYLGERGRSNPLRAAVAISVPFRLEQAAQRLEHGLSRIYNRYLLGHLKANYRRKFLGRASPLDIDLDAIHNLYDYDDRITAPLNGFQGADDYYRRCSSIGYLKGIATPTLIMHALDDPFMYASSVPGAEDLGPEVVLELARNGGHVGFIGGALQRPVYWAERRAAEFVRQEALAPGNL
jgi:predicted alpha/beta-fold hydrolase